MIRAVVGLALALTLTGCVGPARTTTAYEGKAGNTARDAVSQLRTALLAVDTSRRGNLPQNYLEVMLSESEDAFGSIEHTFASIQPPDDERADALRAELGALLGDGSDGLEQLRIAARRQDSTELIRTAQDLVPVADKLARFGEEHHA